MTAQETADWFNTRSYVVGDATFLDRFNRDASVEVGANLGDIFAKYEASGTADQLAAELEERGVKALPDKTDQCALAVDAAAHLEKPELTVRVGLTEAAAATESVENAQSTAPGSAINAQTRLGPVAREFIAKFDQGEYPNLMREMAE